MELKEMLALAALAAGVEIDHWRGPIPMVNQSDYDANEYHSWDPDDDDGDSRRLEVALHMIVGVYESYTSVCQNITPNDIEVDVLGEVVVWHHETNNDPLAATRMAVLRCAAEIGKSMKEKTK
jgi:hypothetical protein